MPVNKVLKYTIIVTYSAAGEFHLKKDFHYPAAGKSARG
jgi:hypothetical protein